MASWAVLEEQIVWISPRATGFTIVCDRCAQEGEELASVSGTMALDVLRGAVECPRGHRVRVERDGR